MEYLSFIKNQGISRVNIIANDNIQQLLCTTGLGGGRCALLSQAVVSVRVLPIRTKTLRQGQNFKSFAQNKLNEEVFKESFIEISDKIRIEQALGQRKIAKVYKFYLSQATLRSAVQAMQST